MLKNCARRCGLMRLPSVLSPALPNPSSLSCVRRPSSIWPSLRRHHCLSPYCCPRLPTLTQLLSNAAAALEVPHRLCLCVCFFCCLLKPRSLLQFHLPTLSLASGSICYCFQCFPLSLSLSLSISLFVLLRCF